MEVIMRLHFEGSDLQTSGRSFVSRSEPFFLLKSFPFRVVFIRGRTSCIGTLWLRPTMDTKEPNQSPEPLAVLRTAMAHM